MSSVVMTRARREEPADDDVTGDVVRDGQDAIDEGRFFDISRKRTRRAREEPVSLRATRRTSGVNESRVSCYKNNIESPPPSSGPPADARAEGLQ